MRTISGGVMFGLLLFLEACAFRPCSGSPTTLAAGLRSQADPSSVRRVLNSPEWTILEQSRLAPKDPRPRYELLRVNAGALPQVPGAKRVELFFLNDRLAGVMLFMGDTSSYVESLGRQAGWSRAPDGSLHRAPGTRVWSWVDRNGEAYAMWEDTCLVAEQTDWISRFACGIDFMQQVAA